MSTRPCWSRRKWMGGQNDERLKSTKSVTGRYWNRSSIPSLAAVHYSVMVQWIWEDDSKQTDWHRKLAFEMLHWTTQSQNTSGHSTASAENNSSIKAQQSNFHSKITTGVAFIGQMPSPVCPRCESGEETAKHLLLFCRKGAVEWQQYFDDSN